MTEWPFTIPPFTNDQPGSGDACEYVSTGYWWYGNGNDDCRHEHSPPPPPAPKLRLDDLISGLFDKDLKVREKSASFLVEGASGDVRLECSAKRLELLAVALKSQDAFVRDAAVSVLASDLIGDIEDAIPHVCQAFWNANDEVARRSAGYVLVIKNPSLLFLSLYDEEEMHRRAAAIFLAGWADAEPEQLILQYMRGNLSPPGCAGTSEHQSHLIRSQTQYAAIAVHGRVNNRVSEAVRTLVAAMYARSNRNDRRAGSAWMALKMLLPDQRRLLDCLGEYAGSMRGPRVHDEVNWDPATRGAIRELDVSCPELVPLLRRMLIQAHYFSQQTILAKLAEYGRGASEASPLLRRLLISGDYAVRAGCVNCLVNIGSREAIPALLESVRTESERPIRVKAALGLLTIAPDDRDVAKRLRSLLKDDTTAYRRVRPSIVALSSNDATRADRRLVPSAKLITALKSRDLHLRMGIQMLLNEPTLIRRLLRTARHWANLGEAPDALVLSFLGDLLRTLHSYGSELGFQGADLAGLTVWLNSCFQNWLRKEYRCRSRQRSRSVSLDPTQLSSDAQSPDVSVEMSDALAKVFNVLEPRDRAVFVASVFDELTIQDIAARLGISKSQVETSLARGRDRVHREISRVF
jgi:RNA polymerase sigma factor (sigma-70 family)